MLKKKKKKKEKHVYEFAKAAITKYHRLGGLITQKYCLRVVEARSLK